MTEILPLRDLLPELRQWNKGRSVSPLNYVYAIARSSDALAYCALFWPQFVRFEGYVLREDFSLETLRSWEAAGRYSRKSIEAAVNYLGLGDLFACEEETDLVYQRIVKLGEVLSEAYRAKLALDFPDTAFDVTVIVEEGEYALTFSQLE